MTFFANLMRKFKAQKIHPVDATTILLESQAIELAREAMHCDDKMPLAARFEDGRWYVQTLTVGLVRTAIIDDASAEVLGIQRQGSR